MKTINSTTTVAMIYAAIALSPALAQGSAPKTDKINPYVDATREMTDSMMQMMGGMLKIWKEASRPVWQSTSEMFGEYGTWCISCHVELESIYDKIGETLDGGVHGMLTDEELSKAADAYNKSKKSE